MADFFETVVDGLQSLGSDANRSDISSARRARSIADQLAGEASQPGFTPGSSANFKELAVRSPEMASRIDATFGGIDERRRQAMYRDAAQGKALLKAGRDDDFRKLIESRASVIKQLEGDPAQTLGLLDVYEQKGKDAAIDEIDGLLEVGYAIGEIDQPGKSPDERAAEDERERRKIELREMELDERIRSNEAKELKLSSGMETVLDAAQTEASKADGNIRRFEALAKDFEDAEDALGGGPAASWGEYYKDITGEQDAISNLRKEWNSIRTSQATANLPPGVASDKDIELALSGFPRSDANAQQVASFLRGQSKLAKYSQLFNTFKADYISNKRGTSGLLQTWNRKYKDANGEAVTMPDIIETSINNGISPEEVMIELGIEQE